MHGRTRIHWMAVGAAIMTSVMIASISPLAAAEDGTSRPASPVPAPGPSSSPIVDWPAEYPELLPERTIRTAGTPANGTWRAMAPAPFASLDGPGVWTGRELLVVNPQTQRTAGYDPAADTWTEYARAPIRTRFGAPAIWIGDEMVLLSKRRAAGLSPSTGSWRELPAHDLGFRDVIAAVWTGDQIVIGSSGGEVASYRPGDDAWIRLPDVPAPGETMQLFWTGEVVLADTREQPWPLGDSSISALDPLSGEWRTRKVIPLDSNAGSSVWTGDKVVYISGYPDGERQHGAYDPEADTWEPWDVECQFLARRKVWLNGLVVADSGRRAIDPTTGTCYRLSRDWPFPPLGRSVFTTAGDNLVAWSGLRALPERPQKRGLILEDLAVPRG
jgi:hypothetical protein